MAIFVLLIMIAQVQNTTNNLHENKTAAAIILVLVFAIAIWKAWPALKANNIFNKQRLYNYAGSKQLTKRQQTRATMLLGAILFLAIAGIALKLYQSMQATGNTAYPGAEFLFFLSFMGLVATAIYAFVNDGAFTAIANIKYSLIVWVTTMLTAPLVLLIMDHHRVINQAWFFALYFNTLWLAHGLGIITLGVLMLAVNHVTKLNWKTPKKRLYILIIAQLTLLLNMFVIALVMQAGMWWLLEVLPYMLIMGLCIWFYPIAPIFYDGES